MPVITVQGLPENMNSLALKKLDLKINHKVAEYLKLTMREVTIFFPQNRINKTRIEIVAFVDGLFVNPSRNAEVREKLAKIVGEVIQEAVKDAFIIECFVRPFDIDKEKGFWCYNKETSIEMP